ncbi:sensor histidine kinase [Clostridium thermarum]|uniref:sensor histidine kinase n=1 Tax=Clostridium thermarum TaxID=1716543 RepID=UPI0013D4A8C2|nr:histidine kinase [Clostridium thermarum]
MKRIKALGLKVYYWFADLSLLYKLMIANTVAILIPTIVIGSYTFSQSMESIKRETALTVGKNLQQLNGDLDRKMSIIVGIANNIAYNKKIQNLFYYGMDFTPEALNYFIDSVAAPIEYALNFNEADIDQIGVFFVNETIPEYKNFIKEERIKEEEWFIEFKNNSNEQMWIYPAPSLRVKSTVNTLSSGDNSGIADKSRMTYHQNSSVLKMVKKIRGIDGTYLGMVTIDILPSDFFSLMNVAGEDSEMYVVNDVNDIIYPSVENQDEVQEYLKLNAESFMGSGGYSYYKNTLYSYDLIPELNIKIINRTAIGNLINSSALTSGYTILAVVIGVFLLEVFTYFALKKIFSRLNQIVRVMSLVAGGNFNIRIPAAHSDEVGQMAHSFNILIEKINTLINDSIKRETAHKDAQLAALQYQINPHFIYNTIDIFRMKLEMEGDFEMADSIASFGKLLRYNMNRDSQYATIQEEVDYVEKYIQLQKVRHGDRIKFEVDLPVELKNVKLIRFILQPIVENSISHGFGRGKRELSIKLNFFRSSASIHIQVIDNGVGISKEKLEQLNQYFRSSKPLGKKLDTDKSIGLENINGRIKLFYGEQYFIKLESVEGEYTKLMINIPFIQD